MDQVLQFEKLFFLITVQVFPVVGKEAKNIIDSPYYITVFHGLSPYHIAPDGAKAAIATATKAAQNVMFAIVRPSIE